MKRVFLTISCALLAANCWGYTIFFFALIAAIVCFLFIDTDKILNKVILTVFLFSLFIDPSIGACSSLIGLLLIVNDYKKEAASFLGSQLPLLLSPIVKVPLIFLYPSVSLLIFALIFTIVEVFCKKRFFLIKIIIASYGVGLAVLSFISWELNPVIPSTQPSGYGIGSAITKLTNKHSSKYGQIIYNNSIYEKIETQNTVYLDHDAKTQWDNGNFQQKRPWGHNLPIGSELFRKAILKDGAWICNIGAALTCENEYFIGGLYQDFALNPIIIHNNGNLIVGDSDFLVDCLAPYQRNLIQYLNGADACNRFFHFSCAIFLIFSCIWAKSIFVGVLCLFNLLNFSLPNHGEVRYVGKKHKWAHTDLGEGVVRVLQQQGVNVIFGNQKAKLLIIGEGFSATLNDETIVIIEPGAQVKVQGKNYIADSIPLGICEGVIDARNIIVDGKKSNSCILRVGHITIIATGTPTAQNKELIWPF